MSEQNKSPYSAWEHVPKEEMKDYIRYNVGEFKLTDIIKFFKDEHKDRTDRDAREQDTNTSRQGEGS